MLPDIIKLLKDSLKTMFIMEKVEYAQMPSTMQFMSDQNRDRNQGALRKRVAYSKKTTMPGKIFERKEKFVKEYSESQMEPKAIAEAVIAKA